MAAIDILRNKIISSILSISDKQYLLALNKIVENENTKTKTFTQEQKLMLQLSGDDIEKGKTVLHADLNKADLEWLNTL
jgi:hypothetical protein